VVNEAVGPINETVNPLVHGPRNLPRSFQHLFAGRKGIAVAIGRTRRLLIHDGNPAKAGRHYFRMKRATNAGTSGSVLTGQILVV
jgi:hypothetical protein